MTESHTFTWRPDLADWSLSHLTIDGQTRRAVDDVKYPGLRWIWAVCAGKTNGSATELPGSERCPACKDWLRGKPPGTTKSPHPAGPKSNGAGAG